MCDERLFVAQIESLPQEIKASVVSFDKDDTIEAYARKVLNTIDRWPEAAVVLIGLSMGGIVAMECIRQAADRICAVVLLDTNPLADMPTKRAPRLNQIERALNGELETLLIEEMKPMYLAPDNQANSTILNLVLAMAADLGPEVFERQSNALMNRRDYSDTLATWHKPALIIYGLHDQLCPPERHQTMHRLMRMSKLRVIDDSGHLPTLESPDQVNIHLQEFLVTIDEH